MYERLAPGGLLVIGNMKAGTDMIWPLEFVEDWSLNYRTPEEMRALAAPLGAAAVELRTESTGYDHFLTIRKPN